jgi:hypothetical protein
MNQAARTMTEVLDICRAHLGPDEKQATEAIRGLGLFMEQLGDLPRAEGLFRELVASARRTSPTTKISITGPLVFLGQVLVKQDKFADAEPVLREALAFMSPTQKKSWLAPRIESLLGMSLLGQDRYADAEPFLLEGFEGLNKLRAQLPFGGETYIPDAHARIVQLYEKWGKPEVASDWRSKSLGAPTQP